MKLVRIRKNQTRRRLRGLDQTIAATFSAMGAQVSILDIPKIYEAGRQAHLAGEDASAAVRAATERLSVHT